MFEFMKRKEMGTPAGAVAVPAPVPAAVPEAKASAAGTLIALRVAPPWPPATPSP